MLLCSLKPKEIPCHLKKLTLTTSIFEGHKGFKQDDPGDFFSEGAYKECEIVGNVHRHPELMEV